MALDKGGVERFIRRTIELEERNHQNTQACSNILMSIYNYLSVCLSICLSICSSACLSVYLSVSLFLCLLYS